MKARKNFEDKCRTKMRFDVKKNLSQFLNEIHKIILVF